MSDRNSNGSSNDRREGDRKEAPNLFLDLFGLTKFFNKNQNISSHQEPKLDEQGTMPDERSIDSDLQDIDLEGDRPVPTAKNNLKDVDRKTMMFAGYVFWAMLFVSGGAVAVTLIARKLKKVPSLAPTMFPTEPPSVSPTRVPTRAPTRAPTQAPTASPSLSPVSVFHYSVLEALESFFMDEYGGSCYFPYHDTIECYRGFSASGMPMPRCLPGGEFFWYVPAISAKYQWHNRFRFHGSSISRVSYQGRVRALY